VTCRHKKLLLLEFFTTNSHISTMKIDWDTKKWH